MCNGTNIPQTLPNPVDGSPMQLVWHDEFNGDSLNSSKWKLADRMWDKRVITTTDRKNIRLEDGEAVMNIYREDGKYYSHKTLTTMDRMSFQYGYLEIYAKVPFSQGSFPAFWLQSAKQHRTVDYVMTEVDVFEVYKKGYAESTLHKWYLKNSGDGKAYRHFSLDSPISYTFPKDKWETLSDEYHLWGFGWTKDMMYMTVDGEVFATYDITDPSDFQERKVDGGEDFGGEDRIGTYTFKNGNFYEGEFVEGQMSGLGVFHFKNGTTFEGEFLNGKIYGDGTLNLVENGKAVSITGFWTPDGKFPASASILFPSGDLYEGPLANGYPTDDGTWTSAEERTKNIDKVEKSTLHKANEFYKRNRETINWCLMGVSTVVTAIEVASASTVVLVPVAGIAQGVNMAINVVDAVMAIGSAAIDAGEAYALGEDTSESLKNLGTEVAINAAFIVVPKAVKALKPLGKGLKNVTRSTVAALGIKSAGKFIAKKTAIKFIKGKIYGKVIKLSASTAKDGSRKVERAVTRKVKATVSVGRMLTRSRHQTVMSNSLLSKLKKNPKLEEQLNLSSTGDASVLKNNMLIIMGKEGRNWMAKNIKIARKAGKKLQVEAHHILTSTPNTENGKKAKKIFEKYCGYK